MRNCLKGKIDILWSERIPLRGVRAVGSVQLLSEWKWYDAPDEIPVKQVSGRDLLRHISRQSDEAKGLLIMLEVDFIVHVVYGD